MSDTFQTGLGVFYALCMVMNFGFAWYYWRVEKNVKAALAWSFVAEVFLLHSIGYLAQLGWEMPVGLRGFINSLAGPVTYTAGTVVLFCSFIYWRKTWTNPHVAWGILNFSFLFAGWGLTDPNFRANLTKPDNVPIPLLIYSVGFFTWLAMRRAVINDERMARGEPPLEKLDDEKVLVWPDLVYTELIAMIICTVLLIAWGILLEAPLEQPATSAKAPNPSKAPWYFLGLQEMLVYFDPWMAGVVLPTFIIIGLIALPYIDFNKQGNGYFTFKQRAFAIFMFLFGFVVLWVVLIVLGTILRGPNWNFFGPFEYWDTHKVDPLTNVNLSQIVWLKWFGVPLETFPDRFGPFFGPIMRELPGLICLLAYFLVLPPLLAKTVLRGFFIRMGFIRFFLLVTLLQFMALLPIKMVLRWTINLKYITYFPEIFFNI